MSKDVTISAHIHITAESGYHSEEVIASAAMSTS